MNNIVSRNQNFKSFPSAILSFVLVSILISNIFAHAQSVVQWTVFTNDSSTVTFEYPGYWKINNVFKAYAGITLFVGDDNKKGSFAFIPQRMYVKPSIEEFAKEQFDSKMSNTPSGKVLEVLEFSKYTINGERAASFVYTSEQPNGQLKGESIITLHGDGGYIFSYTNLVSEFDKPDQKAIRDHIFGSIKWINNSAEKPMSIAPNSSDATVDSPQNQSDGLYRLNTSSTPMGLSLNGSLDYGNNIEISNMNENTPSNNTSTNSSGADGTNKSGVMTILKALDPLFDFSNNDSLNEPSNTANNSGFSTQPHPVESDKKHENNTTSTEQELPSLDITTDPTKQSDQNKSTIEYDANDTANRGVGVLMNLINITNAAQQERLESDGTANPTFPQKERIVENGTLNDISLTAYSDPDGNYQIDFPNTWTIRSKADYSNYVAFSPSDDSNIKFVIYGPYPLRGVTINEVARAEIQHDQDIYDNFVLVRSEPVTINGLTGHQIGGIFADSINGKGKVLTTLLTAEEDFYSIQVDGPDRLFNDFIPTIEEMLSSFRVAR